MAYKDALGQPIGFISRKLLFEELVEARSQINNTPVPTGDNQGYQIGYQLGMSDALEKVCKMLGELPEREQIAQNPKTKAWHHTDG